MSDVLERADRRGSRSPTPPRAPRSSARLDEKTKPRGSLGGLERLAVRIASIQRTADPALGTPVVVVCAADHGVAAEGVSAYPVVGHRADGRQLRRGRGGRERAGAAGRRAPGRRRLRRGRAAAGAGRARPPAGRRHGEHAARPGHAARARGRGARDGHRRSPASCSRGAGCVALGEMGIGNSTAAAALCCALAGATPEQACGRGTGLDDEGLARKRDVVDPRARAQPARARTIPSARCAAVGGFELGVLAGLALGAAGRGVPVLVDGYPASSAVLVAAALRRPCRLADRRAPLVGARARIVLDKLGLHPLLDLELRLGEGSGAALALPLLGASLAILDEMATFASAGVDDSGR